MMISSIEMIRICLNTNWVCVRSLVCHHDLRLRKIIIDEIFGQQEHVLELQEHLYRVVVAYLWVARDSTCTDIEMDDLYQQYQLVDTDDVPSPDIVRCLHWQITSVVVRRPLLRLEISRWWINENKTIVIQQIQMFLKQQQCKRMFNTRYRQI